MILFKCLFAAILSSAPLRALSKLEPGQDQSLFGASRQLFDAPAPDLSVTRAADGTLRFAEAPDSAKRPFRPEFFFEFNASESQEVVDYVQDTLMPSVASLLGRWIRVCSQSVLRVLHRERKCSPSEANARQDDPCLAKLLTSALQASQSSPRVSTKTTLQVRHPTGPLNFEGLTDSTGQPIPPGPGAGGSYDADVLVKVVRQTPFCIRDAEPVLFQQLTRRPIFIELLLCGEEPDFGIEDNLQNVFKELLHALGFGGELYSTWLSARGLSEVVRMTTAEDASVVFGPKDIGQYRSMVTPNVIREAQLHFGCPEMDGALLQERQPDEIPEFWSIRHYGGDLMSPAFASVGLHYTNQAMTDLTLALLQDTGWYDVKYGSGGFNTYGYQAGCALVNGTFEQALADPVASQFLCPFEQAGLPGCFPDFSGQGICRQQLEVILEEFPDWFTVEGDPDLRRVEDCQFVEGPGWRCLSQGAPGRQPACRPGFSCSDTGEVLLEGVLCADFDLGCPPDELMCGSPGLLTCATPELNDCNGRGDCREGRCFCHLGFGGDDCTVPACTTGCPGGTPCPASGFCGIPECGEWSEGDTGKGTPCTSN